ncbi:MAG: hypothetical protein WAN92_05905 [Herbaspirillum sp.]
MKLSSPLAVIVRSCDDADLDKLRVASTLVNDILTLRGTTENILHAEERLLKSTVRFVLNRCHAHLLL